MRYGDVRRNATGRRYQSPVRKLLVEFVKVDEVDSESSPDVHDVGTKRDLVGANADCVLVDTSQVDACFYRRGNDSVGSTGNTRVHGVEEVLVNDLNPGALETNRHQRSQAVCALSDA